MSTTNFTANTAPLYVPNKCSAVLNIKGEHYQCQEDEHSHDGIHSNSEANAIWSC